MTWQPTTEQILNLDGVHRRRDAFRFELCEQDWQPIGELHPDRGQAPTIQANATSPRRLSGLKLTPDEADDIDVMGDRLRVYMVLQNGVEFLLGSFLWGDESEPERSWGTEHHSELSDLGYILAQQQTRPYGWDRGANISIVMHFLLFRAGFSLKNIVVGPEADRGLSEPMSWQPGATWERMLTDLGNVVGFSRPWFDRFGTVYLVQPPDPDEDDATVPAYEAGTRVIADSITRSNDLLDAPNDFGMFDSGTNGRLIVGRAQLPASAPHSFAHRGFRAGKVESTQGIESRAQANRAARNLRRTVGISHQWISFQSTWDPRHDLWDAYSALGLRWLEDSWAGQLRSGAPMSHTARRPIYAAP